MHTLRAIRFPLAVLFVLAVIGTAGLAWSADALPPQLASHFDARGNPDAWMSREGYLRLMGAIGLLFPAFLVGIGCLTAVLPTGSINLPHRDYWLGPDRRSETTRYISRHMAWLACIALVMLFAVNWFVIEANRQIPVRLPNSIWVLLAAFFAAVAVWLGVLIRHFAYPPR